jgi:hypothetical protein
MALEAQKQASDSFLLSLRAFSDRINVSLPTARRMVKRRQVGSVRFNKNIFVPVGEIEKLIQKHIKPALDGGEVE